METRDEPTPEGRATELHWLPFVLPPREEEPTVLVESGTVPPDGEPQSPSPELRRLLDETSDLLESPMASQVLAHMLAVGFELLVDGKLATLAFKPKTSSTVHSQSAAEIDPNTRITEVVEDHSTAKFASVLAVLARQAHVIGNGLPNEYLAVGLFPTIDVISWS
jgi:peroxin-3